MRWPWIERVAWLKRPAVLMVSRMVLAGLFIWACAPKIADPAAFARIVADYRLLPPRLVPLFALTLPWVELAAALFLLVGVFRRAALWLLSLLLLMFFFAISINVVRGLAFSCGCFSVSGGAENPWLLLGRDLLFLLIAAHQLAWDFPKTTATGGRKRSVSVGSRQNGRIGGKGF